MNHWAVFHEVSGKCAQAFVSQQEALDLAANLGEGWYADAMTVEDMVER